MRISDWSSDVCSSDLTSSPSENDHDQETFVQEIPDRQCAEPWCRRLADDGPDRADDASTGDHRVRSVQLQPEHPYRRADAATDQQSDPDAPEPGNEPHQSGEEPDRKSTRQNSSHKCASRMPSSALKKKKINKTYH